MPTFIPTTAIPTGKRAWIPALRVRTLTRTRTGEDPLRGAEGRRQRGRPFHDRARLATDRFRRVPRAPPRDHQREQRPAGQFGADDYRG